MAKEKHIVRASAGEERGESRTDWERVPATSQEESDRLAEEEDGALASGWAATVEIGIPQRKQGVHIRLDEDILEFKAAGPGYQTRINSVLRSFVQAKKRGGPESRRSA